MGFAISAVLLWWVFRGADLGAIGKEIAAASPALLILTGAISTTGGIIRALRWRLLLEPSGARTSFRSRWAALNVGLMVTNLFPARLGEIVRPFALSKIEEVSMSAALGTIVLERALDTVAIILLLLATLLSPAFPAGAEVFGKPIGDTVSVVIVLAICVLGAVAFAVFRPKPFIRGMASLASKLPGRVGRAAGERIEAFLSGLELLRRPTALLQALLWSLLLWVWMASAFWVAFAAFGIQRGFTAAMFTECTLSLFVALPSAPGFLGTMQAGILASLHDVFGVATAPTLSLAVGYHIVGFIPVTLIGIYYAWGLGLRVRSVGEAAAGRADTPVRRG